MSSVVATGLRMKSSEMFTGITPLFQDPGEFADPPR
jgi:hypothetical protein